MESILYEYYDHSIMSEVNREFTPELIKELKSFMVERYVDNMETKDLVAYVTDDLDRYYDKMDDKQFLDEASDYWEDHFSDVVDEVQEYAKCDFKRDRREDYLDSLSEGKDYDITINTDDDYGSKVDALVDSMSVTVEEESTTHRRRDLDSL
jgi:hypothetical protein